MIQSQYCFSGFEVVVIYTKYSRNIIMFTIFCIFLPRIQIFLASKEFNRIRIVLAEMNKKNKWLVDKLGKNQATVSRWCNNVRQPSVETLFDIVEVMDVNVRKLLVSTKNDE